MRQTVPPLAERQLPGLSETLEGPKDPRRCQSCGCAHRPEAPLARWLEHDEWDRVPDRPVVVVLCQWCSRLLIEAHPRLYRQLENGEPFPGCMSICLDCPQRDGVACRSPKTRVNGGPGLDYEYSQRPVYAHLCGIRNGRRFSETRWTHPGRVTGCSGKEAV